MCTPWSTPPKPLLFNHMWSSGALVVPLAFFPFQSCGTPGMLHLYGSCSPYPLSLKS